MTLNAPLLTVNALNKYFGGMHAVVDLSFELYENECLGIIGPNGAGKTTLLNLISGVTLSTSGTMIFLGQAMEKKRSSQIARLGIARTFQHIRLFKQLSVLENITTAYDHEINYTLLEALLRTRRMKQEENKSYKASMELLDLFGMSSRAHHMASSLSYGDQRRLEIARALALKPRLLLLDEPAAGMNDAETRELLALLRWIQREFSLSMILIEHHLPFIMEFSDRLLVLNFGKLLAQGTPSQIRQDRRVIQAYLGEEEA